jgi:hypothetical protein
MKPVLWHVHPLDEELDDPRLLRRLPKAAPARWLLNQAFD